MAGALAWALFLVFSSVLSAEPSVPSPGIPPAAAISASELARLSEISTRLAVLNERLRIELEASNRSSRELEASLATSTLELATLRLELGESRLNSSELATRAGNSELESAGLREALTKADDSLRNLEASFAAYRKEAEAIALRQSLGSLGFAALAASGWLVAILAFIAR
ncbi:MAG: hypothetical protein WCL50_14135 [Spirochaetota bacterium]